MGNADLLLASPFEAIADRQVRAMIEREVDGILIIQTDANAVIPAIRAANEAGIPMVHFNRPPAESDAYSVAIQADTATSPRMTRTRHPTAASRASHSGMLTIVGATCCA